MNRQSLVAKMLHLQVASALVCILLYFALLFATRAGLSYYNNHSDIQQRSIARQVERFQKYVTAQEISAKDTRAIDEWVGQQSFLLMQYVLLRLLFGTDLWVYLRTLHLQRELLQLQRLWQMQMLLQLLAAAIQLQL